MDKEITQANLVGILAKRGDSGPIWSTESDDLDCTFVSWEDGQGIPLHVNSEVDVVMIVLSGYGELTIDGRKIEMNRGSVVLVPKGVERGVRALGNGLAYLNVHKRRRRLMPGNPADRLRTNGQTAAA